MVARQLRHAHTALNIGLLTLLNVNITSMQNMLRMTADPMERESLAKIQKKYVDLRDQLSTPSSIELDEFSRSLKQLPLQSNLCKYYVHFSYCLCSIFRNIFVQV